MCSTCSGSRRHHCRRRPRSPPARPRCSRVSPTAWPARTSSRAQPVSSRARSPRLSPISSSPDSSPRRRGATGWGCGRVSVDYIGSYWLEDDPPALPQRRYVGRVDVAIVGAGVTGSSCALTLADAGLRVRVHEAREVAGGASGRNGGFALRGAAAPYDVARAELGERAASLWRLTEGALERLAGLAGDAFRRTGSLRLAADREEAESLRAEHEALRDDGFEVEW